MAATASGISTLHVGDVRLTYLPDGELCVDPAMVYRDANAHPFAANRHLLTDDGLLLISLGALLVESAGVRAGIDLGWGPSAVDLAAVASHHDRGFVRGGALLASLAQCGLAPDDIDLVLFTHLHRDHTGWLTTGGVDNAQLTFASSTHLLSEAEWTYWSNPEIDTFAPATVGLAQARERIDWLVDGVSPLPGVTAMTTPGHTPGHCSFVISSGGERAIVVGDTLHCPIEISSPELELMADVDPRSARATRRMLDALLAEPGVTTVASHFPEVVFGRVIQQLHGRAFVPAGSVG